MKTKVLIYCTKAKPYLFKWFNNGKTIYECETVGNVFKNDNLNGKIVAECEVECEEIKYIGYDCYATKSLTDSELLRNSCLSFKELDNYLNVGTGYALHITNLKPFDRPLELREVMVKKERVLYDRNYDDVIYERYECPLEHAPQNMQWVWHKGERYCLISIRPEWVCKILNGEKTIEIRKKILKGM